MAKEQGRILVVDDDPLNVLRMTRDLLQQGHQVETANDGPQALEMLQEQSFDVVLLDLIMPDMDGRQVLKKIKQHIQLRDIPVIIISALDEIDSVVECIEKGAEDYLTKPFKPALLKARLNASLGKKKLRDLEVAYLQQEMALRESEKLATLGTLSAGMAHELNNPAAAAQRGVEQMRDTLADLRQLQISLAAANLSEMQVRTLDQLLGLVQQRATSSASSDALSRSDLEYELETVLEEKGVAEAWACAPSLVSMGIDTKALDQIAANFSSTQLPVIIAFLSNSIAANNMLDDIGQGTTRITDIVTALKSYSFLDQAPVQSVDIHKGLDDTLVMLGSKMDGVVVQRDFSEDLPSVQASGSELNQVWTNIIDNAVSAMEGVGEMTLRTYTKDSWLVVQIVDTGAGIPAEIQPRIFDPFFTTMPPGQGAGLGLTSCHRIIVQQHKGEIGVQSEPGNTCVEVQLPLSS
jgi:signal transduction histidine kinase